MILFVWPNRPEAGSLIDALQALALDFKVLRKRNPCTIEIAPELEPVCNRLALDLGLSLGTEPPADINPSLWFCVKDLVTARDPLDVIENDALITGAARIMCNERPGENKPWVCTRPRDHRGDHVAANRSKVVARWAKEDGKEES